MSDSDSAAELSDAEFARCLATRLEAARSGNIAPSGLADGPPAVVASSGQVVAGDVVPAMAVATAADAHSSLAIGNVSARADLADGVHADGGAGSVAPSKTDRAEAVDLGDNIAREVGPGEDVNTEASDGAVYSTSSDGDESVESEEEAEDALVQQEESGQQQQQQQDKEAEAESSDLSSEDEEAAREGELIDDLERCSAVCERLLRCDTLAVDVEGINLGRHGEICIVQVADRRKRVFLFDVVKLGRQAFAAGQLKRVLEAEGVAKLFFDCRGDADALFHVYDVVLRNVLDMQVLCHSAMGGDGLFLSGFAKALGQVLPYAERQAMKGVKLAGQALFAPDRGGSLEIWRRRPLPAVLRAYCAQDVVHLFSMQRQWGQLLPAPTLRAVSEARMRRRVASARPETGPQLARRDFELPRNGESGAPPSKRRRQSENVFQ